MSVTPTLLAQVAEAICLNPAVDNLRYLFPGVHFTACLADDIVSRVAPALETDHYELYLVSSGDGHCLSLTSEFEDATGIVIAAKTDEDA